MNNPKAITNINTMEAGEMKGQLTSDSKTCGRNASAIVPKHVRPITITEYGAGNAQAA